MNNNFSIFVNEGFTLIEIMIALVILSFGLVALAGVQISAIKGNAFSRRITTAVSVAEQTVEQIKTTPYNNIQSQSPSQVTASNMNFSRQVSVTDNTPLPNMKTVQVTLTWNDGGKSHTVPVSTVISRP